MSALNNGSSTGDVNMEGFDQLNDLIKRLTKIESAMTNFITKEDKRVLENDLKEVWKVLNYVRNDKIPKMDVTIETHAEDIEKLKQEIRRLDLTKMDKTKFDELLNMINDLKKKLKDLAEKTENLKDYSKEINDLKTATENITNNHNAYVDANNNSIFFMKEDMKNFATMNDLENLKNLTQEEMDKMNNEIQDKLDLKADKLWVEQMLKKNNRDKTPNKHIDADDAMFSRKPLLQSLCASCDSDLKALKGVKADYVSWKNMPERQNSGRIANLGSGFSRMLMMMNQDSTDDDLYALNSTSKLGSKDDLGMRDSRGSFKNNSSNNNSRPNSAMVNGKTNLRPQSSKGKK